MLRISQGRPKFKMLFRTFEFGYLNLFTPLDKKISVLIPTGTFSLYLQFPEDQIKCISNGV